MGYNELYTFIRVCAVFLFIGLFRVDPIEAQQNIETYSGEIEKWQSLSHGLITREEKILVIQKIQSFKNRIVNECLPLL